MTAPTPCLALYERPGRRYPTDRIIRCHLQKGHPGEHEEADTEVTWLADAPTPEPSTDAPPLDLDDARDALADDGIDGPDLPYNPRALRAMRVADALLAEVAELRPIVAAIRDFRAKYPDTFNAGAQVAASDLNALFGAIEAAGGSR